MIAKVRGRSLPSLFASPHEMAKDRGVHKVTALGALRLVPPHPGGAEPQIRLR
jgi:hypothetical protein